MNRRWLLIILVCNLAITSYSQTLFTYGKYEVDAKEFMRAYNKNNTIPIKDKAQAIKDYLNLYIKSKLKIREAYDRQYDTLPQLRSEVDNLRTQIVDNYMTDPETSDRLVNEAFQRSQKDIHVAHIFIAFKNTAGVIDTAVTQKKLQDVLQRLQKGDDFLTVAQQFSDDPSAKTNKGDIGYITVFTLPYELETLAYTTPVGKYSTVFRSRVGYHIFKNLGERKALGKMKAQQILLAFPPDADEATKKTISHTADSLYKLIVAGGDFAKLAAAYSNDYLTAVSGGTMHEFSVGQYDPIFETTVWSLKDGAISKPFATQYGYHIVKRISVTPIVTDPKDKINQQALKDKAINDNRWQASRDVIFNQVVKAAGFKTFPYNQPSLWAYTDSMLDRKPIGTGNMIEKTAPLFKIGDSILNVQDWLNYAQTYRFKSDGSGVKPYDQVMDEFVHTTGMNYYRDHLESFNEEFRDQMTEFKEGNLFFEIMQREIWNKSQADSAGLVGMYDKNRSKYLWEKSADAVVFFCSDEGVGKLAFDAVKKNPANWKKAVEPFAEKVIADSARYEWEQIPNPTKAIFKPKLLTNALVNKTDNTVSFAYILKVYPQPMQRSFNEAKGLVISDYQNQLEDQWVNELKKKYPVVVNQKVLDSLLK